MARDLAPPVGRDLTPPPAAAAADEAPPPTNTLERIRWQYETPADKWIRDPVGSASAAFTGFAHGISSGQGPVSRLIRESLLRPGEAEEVAQSYEAEPSSAKKVGEFVGSMATPESAVAGQVIGAGLKAAPAALGPIGQFLERMGLKQGKRVLMGGADPLAVKVPVSDEATRAAFDVGAIAPGQTTQHAATVLKAERAKAGDVVGKILSDLEAKGVQGPDALALARQLRAKATELEQRSAGTGAPELYRKIADDIEAKVGGGAPAGGGHHHHGGPPPAQAMAGPGTSSTVPPGYTLPGAKPPGPPPDTTLSLSDAEGIKRSLQEKAVYDAVQKDKIIAAARKDMASAVRQAVEDAVSSQAAKAPESAAAFVPSKERLGNLIEASNVANKGAAQAARRNAFSLRDTILGSGAGVAGAAAAGPLGALAGPGMAIASHLARTRGTPTLAWGAYNAGRALTSAAGAGGPIGLSVAGPAVAAETPGWLEQLGLRVGMAPAAAAPATPSTSTGGAPRPGDMPNGPWRKDTSGPPGFAITGAMEDPAQHFLRWMRDPNYRAANGSGGK